MVPKDRFAPSQNGKPLGTAAELLSCFQHVEHLWKQAEEKLAETHVPVDVRVRISCNDMESDQGSIFGTIYTYLSYAKIKGSRRICFTTERDYLNEEGTEVETKPITEWPVDIRIQMFEHFPKLYAEAESVAKSYVPKIKEAISKFETTLLMIDI